jgi:uncharacterized protein (UPF0210 family)
MLYNIFYIKLFFVSSFNAKKNKSKKLLNLINKPIQQQVKQVNSNKNIAESVNDKKLNELHSSEDDDEDESKVTGIPNFVILNKSSINIINLF